MNPLPKAQMSLRFRHLVLRAWVDFTHASYGNRANGGWPRPGHPGSHTPPVS